MHNYLCLRISDLQYEIKRNPHHLRNLPEDHNCNPTAETNLDNSEKGSDNSTIHSSLQNVLKSYESSSEITSSSYQSS